MDYRLTTVSYPVKDYTKGSEEDFRSDIGVIDKKWRGQGFSTTTGVREIRYKNLTPYQVVTLRKVAQAHFPKSVKVSSRVYKD